MIEENVKRQVELLITRYPKLEICRKDILEAYQILRECFENNCKLLVAGNGGSCADANHIVGELMKGFCKSRPCSSKFSEKLISVDRGRGKELAEKLQGGLPVIALDNHACLNTAYANDVNASGRMIFAQQVYGYGKQGDVFWGISTSGNSENILDATVVARALGMKVIGLTGACGGKLLDMTDVCIKVPEDETYVIQELHLPIYHCLCLMLENTFF